MVWTFNRRPGFLRQFRRLDGAVQERINGALRELAGSENPTALGRYKPGMRVFAYNVGKYRIIFGVKPSQGVIDLIRVCDHKSAYGRD